MIDNSSMEPAEWDGSNPVVPKLGSGDHQGSFEKEGNRGSVQIPKDFFSLHLPALKCARCAEDHAHYI